MAASKRIAMAFSGGLIAEVVNRIVPIVILHFVAVRIGVERFGYAQFGIQIMDLAIFFILFGFHTIGAVQIGAAKNQPELVGKIIAETTTLKLLFALVTAGTMFGLVGWSSEYRQFLPLIMALSFILFTTAIDMNYVHIGTQKVLALSLMIVVAKVISLIAIIALVRDQSDTILYAVLVLGANGLVSLVNWFYNIRKFPYRGFALGSLKQRVVEATPYAITVLLLICLDRFDLFVIQHYGDTEQVGLYAAPARLYFSIINVVSALGGVFFAELVALQDQEKFTRVVQLSFKAMLLMIVPVAGGAWFVDRELIELLVGPQFLSGAEVLSVLLLACIPHVAIVVFGLQVLQVRKASAVLNLVLGLALVSAVVIAVGLYLRMGMLGVAWALVIVKTLAALALAWLIRPHVTRVPVMELFKIGIPGLVMVAALAMLDSAHLLLNLVVGAVVFAVAVLSINRRELQQLWLTLRAARQ